MISAKPWACHRAKTIWTVMRKMTMAISFLTKHLKCPLQTVIQCLLHVRLHCAIPSRQFHPQGIQNQPMTAIIALTIKTFFFFIFHCVSFTITTVPCLVYYLVKISLKNDHLSWVVMSTVFIFKHEKKKKTLFLLSIKNINHQYNFIDIFPLIELTFLTLLRNWSQFLVYFSFTLPVFIYLHGCNHPSHCHDNLLWITKLRDKNQTQRFNFHTTFQVSLKYPKLIASPAI